MNNIKEVIENIKSYSNEYEKNKGIKTLSIECLISTKEAVLIEANKGDNTQTLFFALKTRRGYWQWFCPTDEQVKFLQVVLPHFYLKIDYINEIRRESSNGNSR